MERPNFCNLDLKEYDHLFHNDICNYAKCHYNFDYYSTHAFHKLKTKTQLNIATTFSLLHTNIQSLQKNKDNLEIFLNNVDFDFDVIALSETWHNGANNALENLSLSGYHPYNGIAGHSKSGGCGFFVNEDINFNILNTLNNSFKDENCEFYAFWIEFDNTVLGVIYNHPRKNPTKFLEYLDDTLKKLRKENKQVLISGDFNLDLLRTDKIKAADQFINLMFSNCYQPLILQPTRYTAGCRPSLIDNIFINSHDFDAVSGNFTAKISDHMPNFVILNKKLNKNYKTRLIKRDFRNFKDTNFIKRNKKHKLYND